MEVGVKCEAAHTDACVSGHTSVNMWGMTMRQEQFMTGGCMSKSVACKCGLPGNRSENPVASVAKPIQADSAVIP